MRQLKTYQQIIGGTKGLRMGGRQRIQKGLEAVLIRGRGQRLTRIRAAVGLNGSGFATPN